MAKAKKAAPKKAAPKKGKKVEEAVTSEEESPPSPPAPASPAQGQSGAESDAEEEPVVKKGRGRPTSKAAAAPKKAAPSPKGKGKKAATPKRKSASKSKEPAAKSKPSGPAAKKSKPGAGASSGSEEDETDYEVERILEVQFLRNGKKEFLVQWKGFGKNGSTWEPEENLADCKGLLQAFMSKLENLREKSDHDLRVERKQTQRYFDSNRNAGVRSSRRFTSKPRVTYHGLVE